MANSDAEAEKVALILSKTIREEIAELGRKIALSRKYLKRDDHSSHDAEQYVEQLKEQGAIRRILALQLTDTFPEWGEPGRSGWSREAYQRMLKELLTDTEGTSPA